MRHDIRSQLHVDSLQRAIDRRAVLKGSAALALSIPAVSALLAACGGGGNDESTATTAPSGAGQQTTATTGETGTAATPAATTTSGGTTAQAGGTFIYADGTEPPALDPPSNTGPFEHVVRGLFEPMLSNDNPQLEPQPRLATKWSVSNDNLTWTFDLKQGVMFHDGSEFTSDAVKYSYDRVKDPALDVSRRSLFDVIEETTAVSPYVVEVKTAKVFPDLLFFLSDIITCIVNPTVAEQYGPEEFGLHPSGTGPFVLSEWVTNDHITLERFADYHDTPPTIDKVTFKAVPEASSREAMLRAGEAHLIYSPPTESVADLQSASGVNVDVYDSLTVISWEMRVTQPPFSDKRVRQAMNYAVDKQAIVDEIMSGLGKIMVTPAPPGVWGAIELDPYPYDPEKAKSLMNEAGFENGFDGTFFYVSGRWAGDDQVAQATQSYWAAIGANVEIRRIDMGSLGEWLSRDPDEMAGAIAGLIRTSTYIDYHLYRLFHSEATTEVASQRSGYVNPEVDRLINEARATFDEDQRAELYGEVQRIVWDDAPFIWLFSRQDVLASSDGVSGFTILPNNLLLYKDVQIST